MGTVQKLGEDFHAMVAEANSDESVHDSVKTMTKIRKKQKPQNFQMQDAQRARIHCVQSRRAVLPYFNLW